MKNHLSGRRGCYPTLSPLRYGWDFYQQYQIMQCKIIGYHQDEYNDWVAELDCHHGQHVRHDPPFVNRSWVSSEQGRNSKLGESLNCKKCDENAPADSWD